MSENKNRKVCLLTLLLLTCFLSCNIHSKKITAKNIYCYQLDTIEDDFYLKKSNPYLDKYIPKIEEVSHIKSKGNNGIDGYDYDNDSSFRNDMKLWNHYFDCP
jgi:hypothetical protein